MEIVYTILFQFLRENHSNNTNTALAHTLIMNLDKIQNMSVDATARLCHCSSSTLNRFCQLIGLRNFRQLKKCLKMKLASKEVENFDQTNFTNHINDNLAICKKELTPKLLQSIIEQIHISKRITIFGFQDNQTYTLDFQLKMISVQKYVETISFLEIEEVFNTLTEDDLAIMISFNGTILSEMSFLKKIKNSPAKTILITQAMSKKELIQSFDNVISVGKYCDFGEENYALVYILDSLFYGYSKFLKDPSNL